MQKKGLKKGAAPAAPPPAPRPVRVTLVLPADIVEGIDAHARRLNETNPGLEATRSDAARVLIKAALFEEKTRGATDG